MWLILELNNFISCNVQNAILSGRIVLLVKKRKRSSNPDVDNPRTKVFRRRTITVSILFAIIPFIFLICITSFFSLYLYQSRAYACRYLRTHVGCPKEGICTFIIDFIKSLNEEKNHNYLMNEFYLSDNLYLSKLSKMHNKSHTENTVYYNTLLSVFEHWLIILTISYHLVTFLKVQVILLPRKAAFEAYIVALSNLKNVMQKMNLRI